MGGNRKDKERRSADRRELVTIRLSTVLYQKLKAVAARERRSLSAQAALYVEQGLARDAA